MTILQYIVAMRFVLDGIIDHAQNGPKIEDMGDLTVVKVWMRDLEAMIGTYEALNAEYRVKCTN